MAFVKSLQLTNFRCYDSACIADLSAGAVVLYGANGAGKTNILEALSLLTPGRGMRAARIEEIQKSDTGHPPWALSALMETAYGETQIGTGRDADKDRRVVRINGDPARSQDRLSEYSACVWLTPQMDRLFLDPAGSRRRFLDRLVFAYDAGHAGRIRRYENAMSQRSRILKENAHPDPAWLSGLESTMAETGVAIAAGRQDFVCRLQDACERNMPDVEALFPRAFCRVTGTIEELIRNAPALEVEDMFKYQLEQTRSADALTGGAATGPHKSDMRVFYAAKDMPADQCSTGEQKALLIGIMLAHSRLLAADRGAPPLLLLDEVAAHLDDRRRSGLYEQLMSRGGQVWLTGTDENLFSGLAEKAAFFRVHNGAVAPCRKEYAA